MPWTYLRVAGSLLGRAAITLTLAVPASARASTLSAQDPGVGASSMVSCGISYPTKDFGRWGSFPASNWSGVRRGSLIFVSGALIIVLCRPIGLRPMTSLRLLSRDRLSGLRSLRPGR
jgi:hypothetical protein